MNKRKGARDFTGIFHPIFIQKLLKMVYLSVIMGLQKIP